MVNETEGEWAVFKYHIPTNHLVLDLHVRWGNKDLCTIKAHGVKEGLLY